MSEPPQQRGRAPSIHVQLGYGQGANKWTGPDRVPYGYHHAESQGCAMTYSQDHDESPAMRLTRRALRRVLGTDLIHTYRNREEIRNCDVVWTHTENENLAVLALLRWRSAASRPKVIAQSVHLFDVWHELPEWKRQLYRRILQDADVLSVHSDENLRECRRIFPLSKCTIVKPGVALEDFPITVPKFDPAQGALRLASLGNDMHRDWNLLLEAFGNREGISMRVAIPRYKRQKLERMFAGYKNCELLSLTKVSEIRALYAWADVVVVPLARNLHASGITVVLEAITQGKPVVAANTGGLEAFFPGDEIFYYECGQVDSLRSALTECISNSRKTVASITKAQQRILREELTSVGRAHRNVALSRELLSEKDADAPDSKSAAPPDLL